MFEDLADKDDGSSDAKVEASWEDVKVDTAGSDNPEDVETEDQNGNDDIDYDSGNKVG